MDARLLACAALFCVGIVADMATTYVALTAGPYVEASPVGRRLITRFGLVPGMLLTKAVGMAVVAVPVAAARFDRRTALAVMLAGVGLLSLGAAGHNLLVFSGVL
ncbi:hypothetical protein GCM10027435_14800 [Haloparvum alkalitolerans]|uniref:hypothetical protein n=1 Tax=Haloparvum alkalitolerans TaxID=1042953 RepID=UPI003CF63B18